MTTRGVLQNKKQSDQNDKSSTNTNEVSEEEQEDMEHAVDEVETHEEEGTNTDTDTDKQTEDTHTTSTASIWTDELKNMLVRACVKHGVGDWDAIKNDNAFDFGDMTSEDLHTEFKLLFPLEYKRLYPGAISAQNGNRLFNQWPLPPNGFRIKNRTRVPFTSEEDAAIYEGVTKFGAKWAHIASVYKLKRSGVAIRDRVRCRYPEIYALLGFEDKRTHVEKRRNHQKALQDAAPSPSLLETTHPVAVRREETNDTLNNNALAESSIPSPELEDEANLLNTITPAMTSTSTTISTTNPMHSTPLNPFKRPVNTFDGLYGTPIDERSPQYKLAKTSFTSRITRNIQAANANTTDTTTTSAQKPQAELVNMSYMSNAGMNESNNATNKRQLIIRDTFEEDPYETLPVDGQLAEEATFTLHSPVLPSSNRQPKGKQAFTSPSHKTPEKLRYLIGASSTTPRSAPSRELTRTPTPNRANIWRTSLDAQSLRNEEYQAETSRRLSYQNTLRNNIDDLVNSSTSRLSRVLDNAPPLPEPDSMLMMTMITILQMLIHMIVKYWD
ncbi:hypothetical protein BDF22DRAFT_730568 [Syncephalis plumigaleata]|nr:hypothetical protein BDF22DRAFT_730568 [Syncephalis plumigaleata]